MLKVPDRRFSHIVRAQPQVADCYSDPLAGLCSADDRINDVGDAQEYQAKLILYAS